MSSALTIFGKKADYGSILAIIREKATAPVEVSGSSFAWESATVRGSDATVTFNPLLKVRPGDQFSKIVLGAANFFRRIKTPAISNQTYLKEFLFDTKIIIGVVADPELMESAGHFDLIFDVADECEGLIFNGNGMVDPSGNLLLNNEGEYDRLL